MCCPNKGRVLFLTGMTEIGLSAPIPHKPRSARVPRVPGVRLTGVPNRTRNRGHFAHTSEEFLFYKHIGNSNKKEYYFRSDKGWCRKMGVSEFLRNISRFALGGNAGGVLDSRQFANFPS